VRPYSTTTWVPKTIILLLCYVDTSSIYSCYHYPATPPWRHALSVLHIDKETGDTLAKVSGTSRSKVFDGYEVSR